MIKIREIFFKEINKKNIFIEILIEKTFVKLKYLLSD